MTYPEDIPSSIEKTARELAEILQRDEQEILTVLQATPSEIEELKKDPTFCAVMNDISINAMYLFDEHRGYIRQVCEPLITIGLDALKFTPNRRETNEGIGVKVARLRAQNLTTRNLFPNLNEQYVLGRIRLGICLYWNKIYEERIPAKILMLLPEKEREEFFNETNDLMSLEVEREMEAAFREIGGAVRSRVEDIEVQEVGALIEMGVHPKIAQKRVDVVTAQLTESLTTEEYPTREELMALAMDQERLLDLAKIAIPSVENNQLSPKTKIPPLRRDI